jgi:hypothetical protein
MSESLDKAQKKLTELKQALSVARDAEDRATWASDFASYTDITRSMELISDAASMAIEQLEHEIDYIQEQIEEYDFKLAEFEHENSINV